MHMHTTGGSGRIVKRKLANGDLSFSFSICRHVRILGQPRHTLLAGIGTFRQSELVARAEEFWSIVDKVLADLIKANKLWTYDPAKIERQFSAVIPRPTIVAAKPVEPEPESNREILNGLVARLAEKAERKLAKERGISL